MIENVPKERNLGIDALRILAMLMICLLHVFYTGGFLYYSSPETLLYRVSWFLECAAYCGVNCYALISGYVCVKAEFKWSKIVIIWLQVVFYELLLCLFFTVQNPTVVVSDTWLNAFTPIISNEYWYISAYAGMFPFIPLMNIALNKISKRRLEQSLVFCFILLILLQFVKGPTRDFALNNGYSIIWISVLYLFGGYVRLYVSPLGAKKTWLLPIYAAAVLFTFASKILGDGRLVSYTSPTVFIAALALLLFFANLEINKATLRRLITTVAPTTLGIYLIHTNPLVFNYILPVIGKKSLPGSLGCIILIVIGAAIAIFIFSSLVDLLRIRLFKVLRVGKAAGRLDALLEDKQNSGGIK